MWPENVVTLSRAQLWVKRYPKIPTDLRFRQFCLQSKKLILNVNILQTKEPTYKLQRKNQEPLRAPDSLLLQGLFFLGGGGELRRKFKRKNVLRFSERAPVSQNI